MMWSRVTLSALLVGAAACAAEDGADVSILSFELERAEPPADDRGGLIVVGPRSDLHFGWQIRGTPQKVALLANERVIAEWAGGQVPDTAADLCGEDRCATAFIGEVQYRLKAWDGGGASDARDVSVRIADQGLQVLSFTSDPASIEPGAAVTLAWKSAGATEATLEATPLGGGETRALGSWQGEEARDGSYVDDEIVASTLYRLTITDDEGRTASAEIPLPLRGEAWLTSIAAEPQQAASGEPITLSWQSVGLERLTILRDDGAASITDIAADELDEGAREVRIDRDTTFSFIGATADGLVIIERCDDAGCSPAKITVAVHPGPAIVSFTADEAEIESGGTTTLRWQVLQADEVAISWADASGSGVLTIPAGAAEQVVTPGDTARYTLVATGGGHNASRQLLLGVRPRARLVGPSEVGPGEAFELSWTTRGATRLQLLVDDRPVELGDAVVDAGSVQVRAPASAVSGSTFDVVLTASDDETPRRRGIASMQITVE